MKSFGTILMIILGSIHMCNAQALTADIDDICRASLNGQLHAWSRAELLTYYSTGGIDLHVNGGHEPYQYLWSNGEQTEDIGNLSLGQYCVTVTDALCGVVNKCFNVNESNCSFWLARDEELNLCPETKYGRARFGMKDGNGPIGSGWYYSVPWEFPSGERIVAHEIDVSESGVYNIHLPRSKGGSLDINLLMGPIQPLASDDFVVNNEVVDATCYGRLGSIEITSVVCSGNNLDGYHLDLANLTDIVWSDGVVGTLTRSGLSPGQYDVTMKICGDIELSDNYTVGYESEGARIVLEELIAHRINVNTGAFTPGRIDISVEGGQVASIVWTLPDGTFRIGEDVMIDDPSLISLYGATIYTVEVTLADGCVITRSFDVCTCFEGWPDGAQLAPCHEGEMYSPYDRHVDYQSPSAQGIKDGYINVPTHFPIEWTGPDGFVSYEHHIGNLGPGIYCYRIVGMACEDYFGNNGYHGMTGEDCIELVDDCSSKGIHYAGNHLSISQVPTCPCEEAGRINIRVRNPVEDETWSVALGDDRQSDVESMSFINLGHGIHHLVIHDSDGCRHELSVTVGLNEAYISRDPVEGQCGRYYTCGGCEDYYVAGQWVDGPNVGCDSYLRNCEVNGVVLFSDVVSLPPFILTNWVTCEESRLCLNGEFISERQGVPVEGYYITEDPERPGVSVCGYRSGCSYDGEFVQNDDRTAFTFGEASVQTDWIHCTRVATCNGSDVQIEQEGFPSMSYYYSHDPPYGPVPEDPEHPLNYHCFSKMGCNFEGVFESPPSTPGVNMGLAEVNMMSDLCFVDGEYLYQWEIKCDGEVVDIVCYGQAHFSFDSDQESTKRSDQDKQYAAGMTLNDDRLYVVAPNPFSTGLTLLCPTFEQPENLIISIFDMRGVLIDNMDVSSQTGDRNTVDLGQTGLNYAPSGVYLLRVVDSGGTHFLRAIKAN